MFDQNTELDTAQQWATIRQNQEYQRAFDETMAVLLAETKPLETILAVLSRPRVAQKSEGTSNAV